MSLCEPGMLLLLPNITRFDRRSKDRSKLFLIVKTDSMKKLSKKESRFVMDLQLLQEKVKVKLKRRKPKETKREVQVKKVNERKIKLQWIQVCHKLRNRIKQHHVVFEDKHYKKIICYKIRKLKPYCHIPHQIRNRSDLIWYLQVSSFENTSRF